MISHNQLTSLAVLIFILSTCLGTSLAKQHPVRHAHSRHKRQYGHPSDFVPDSYIVEGSDGPEYGNWSPWSAPSECSRTCGGGVAYQTRHCLDVSPDGRPYCRGGTKRYFSCNVEDCHEYSDYRSEQCAEYNRVPFEDKYYDWIPYTKAPNLCELNCMPRGERFYYRHNKKVVDGTRCDDEKLDVCVDGRCLPVGCDRLLGSSAREDNCRECGGDGSSCNRVEGLLDNNDLQVGYNDILLIPAGATNIQVKEIQPTNNYLAVRNTTGHYYLNGNWRIDFPRKLRFAGTVFHYERKPHGFYAPESITALGPTLEPIYISLLYQEPNPGVMYEYSIPKGISPHSLTDNYTWVEGEFGPCSMTCGGGTQQRNVMCVRRRDTVQVPENLCNANYMPTSMRSCSPEPCPPSWNAGPWSECSESCKRGIQERQVYCMQIISNGLPSVADESECEKTGEKPPNKQECNVNAVCPTWHVGPWKSCDKLCGEGKETRDVRCYRKTDGRIEVLEDSACPEEKPESEKPCMIRPCEGVDWITSEWSGCEEKCGLSQETRTALCVTQMGVVFPESFCHKYRKPELVRKCESTKKCEHEWYATQWSECSSKCSSGVRTRKVFCGEINDEGLIKKVDDDKCNAADKYDSEKECVGEEECKGDWFAGPWSGCSKDCGGGQKTRKVLCVQDNNTVSITNCDGNSIPFSSESCNNHPCGEDEVYTVEPTHDLSQDDEEQCDSDEDYADEYEDEDEVEGQTPPMESTSKMSTSSDVSTEWYTGFSSFSILSTMGYEPDMSSLTTLSGLSSSSEPSTAGLTDSSESSVSTESSSVVTLSSDIGTDSSLSSMSSGSSTDGDGSSVSTDSSSMSSSLDSSTEYSTSGSTDFSASDQTELTSSTLSEMADSTALFSTADVSSQQSTESSSSISTESTESTKSSSSVSTEGTISTESSSSVSTESTESTESSSSVSTESTEFTESSSSVATESTESTESSSSVSTESTECNQSSSSVSTESTESSSSVSTESTEFTESSSSVSTESTESTESSSSVSTESTKSTESSSSVSTESTESTESSSSVSTESTESTESSSSVSTESTESTESSSSVSTESTESTESSSSVSTESTESTESSSSVSTESTESTESSSSESTESTESSSSESTESTDATESSQYSSTYSTDSSSTSELSSSTSDHDSTAGSSTLRGIGEVDVDDYDETTDADTTTSEIALSDSTESSGSTGSSSSVSTESTETTESTESSSMSTETTGSTESSFSVSTESTESSSSVSTESTESSSSVSTESTESTESSSSVSTDSTEFTESSSSVSTESTEFTESSSSVSAESTESTGSSSSVSTESTESTESSSSVSTESTESTESSSSVSTESTESTESSSSVSPESTESTESSSPLSTDFTDSTDLSDKWSTTSFEDLWGPSMSSIKMAITKEQKLKKCKPRKRPKCRRSEFGCCPDNKTPAEGPFGKGCPQPQTCNESEFGCCLDGVSPAKGPNEKGCPHFDCNATLFGCCPDKVSVAQGNDYEGCPEEMLPAECTTSQFGCCPDNMTSATGPHYQGCFVCEGSGDCATCNDTTYGCCPDNLRAATGPNYQGCEEGSGEDVDCANSTYGCCPDGIISAEGPNFENCGVIDSENCTLSYFGCCPDGITPALGGRYEGCKLPCESEAYGCCDDHITPAHGPNREGCCLNSPYGCCPDNILYARGPNFEGCGCQFSPYGCCPDNQTASRGYNNEGCGCQYTAHGCCPDNYTPAPGPGYQGCPCYTFQFGCCPDGVTIAKGPQRLGCGCDNTEFGCCSDGQTPAMGPNKAGCGCEASQFGCCPDGVQEALGEDFDGCRKQLKAPGAACKLPKDRGSCRDFTVKWFYDMQYGGCTRFWYGGCEGNDNKFKTQEECHAVCVAPENKDRCHLPKVAGPCEKYFPKWYYDTERKQCGQFIYGGCLGNNNNFDTREDCQQVCAPEQAVDPCDQPVEEGPCEGNFTRWHYDKERKVCSEFRYGGCRANGNNFLTESACKEQCLQPGRSHVAEFCLLEKDPGPCRGSVLRWYYDDKAGSCRRFFYGGCLGNNNRFRNEAECKKKCFVFENSKRDHCSLPREPGNCGEKLPRWYFDNSENRCMPFYYTGCEGNDNRFETLEECETDCPPRVYKDLCHLPALIGECYNYTERWYYDAQAGRCSPFYYGGCGGNHNNFETQIDCQKRCEAYIPEERVDIATPRPVTAEPEQFRTEYCFYGSDPGSCGSSEFIPKWFYDRADGVCKQFLYGGCDGNGNRFDSREECEHYCGNAQDLCILPKTVGPCSGNHPQWYYDRQNDTCYEFDYGGCQGNGNRFNTRYDCEIRCKQGAVQQPTAPPTALVPTQPPPRPHDPTDICHHVVDPGPCLGEYSSWYYDPQTRRCQAFVYGGCLGNANRFDSEEQCERQCGQFRGEDVCTLPYDVGPCDGQFQKWFYDATNRVCREFTYSGCGGNSNRFSSLQECETLCFHREEALPISNDTNLPHQAICRLPVDVGPCRDVQIKRWHYDESRKTCVPFIYSGCGGNFNRFKNFETCIKFCMAQMRDIAPAPPLFADPNEIIVQVPEYCKEEQRKCSELHCPYGVEKFVDSQDCERCRCNNPCREHYCPEATRCAVELYHDETGRVTARGICREENKTGQCPPLADGSGSCTAECQSDADCPGPRKCCTASCANIPMTSCVDPVQPVVPSTTTTTSHPIYQRPFYGAQPPVIVADEMHVSAPEGNYATLKCSVRGIPTPVVSWRKDNLLIDGSGGRHRFLVDGSLQIIGLQSSDAGVYQCEANNGVGHPAHKEFTLEVTDATPMPAEVIGDENTYVVVTLGTPVILQCYAIGWPRPGVTWWRGDRMLPLSSGQFEQRRDFSLLIKSISLRNLGPYVCQAYNGLGKAASGTVTVQATGPVYSTNPQDEPYFQYLVNVPQQRPETTHRPIPTYRPQVQTYTTHALETTHVQTRPPTQPPTPYVEPATQQTPRVFQVPLAVNISMEQTSFPTGSDISIPCIVDGYPIPRVTWYKDNEVVYPTRKIEITESNRLRIIRADGSDSGNYRCVAQNQFEEASNSVSITVEGIYIHPNCTDNVFFANCELIVKARHCQHKYYARFCCKSCTQAGQLPSHGTHLDEVKQASN